MSLQIDYGLQTGPDDRFVTRGMHLCPEMRIIRCKSNFDIQHEVSRQV